jgi:hypothetical protein
MIRSNVDAPNLTRRRRSARHRAMVGGGIGEVGGRDRAEGKTRTWHARVPEEDPGALASL